MVFFVFSYFSVFVIKDLFLFRFVRVDSVPGPLERVLIC